MLRLKQLPTFDSVAAGKKAVVDLPLGLRYHCVWLELGNNAVAANAISDLVEDIVVKINGKPQRTHSGFQLNVLNGINGSAFLLQASGTNGQADRRLFLPIWFAEPWRKNQAEVSSLALRANGIQSLQIEVNVKAGLAAPIVQGWYEFDYDNREIGLISKMVRQDYSAVDTSRDIVTIDKRDFIELIHFFLTSDGKSITEVKVTANGEEIRDRITFAQNVVTLTGRELTPAIDGGQADQRIDAQVDLERGGQWHPDRHHQADGTARISLHEKNLPSPGPKRRPRRHSLMRAPS